MVWIRRKWSPADADEWTKEDWIAIVISPVAYIGIAGGVALSILLIPVGFIVLAAAIILTILMHWVIGPKLRMISQEYEKKQKEYLEALERTIRWEKTNG